MLPASAAYVRAALISPRLFSSSSRHRCQPSTAGAGDQYDLLDDRVTGQPDPREAADPQRGDRVPGIPHRLRHRPADPGADLLQDRPEQGLLAPEVVVERAAADPRVRQHRLDRRAVVAVRSEQPCRDVDQMRPGGLAPLDILVHPPPRYRLTDRLPVWNS